MNTSDSHAEPSKPEQVTQDPLAILIAQVEAERAQGASDTQAFMRYMSEVNAEEFGPSKPYGWPVSRWVLVVGFSVAVAALIIWGVLA